MASATSFPPPLANGALPPAAAAFGSSSSVALNGHHAPAPPAKPQPQLQQQPQEQSLPLSRILEAHATIGPLIHLTPVLRCEAIDNRMACRGSARGPRRLFFKVCMYVPACSACCSGVLHRPPSSPK